MLRDPLRQSGAFNGLPPQDPAQREQSSDDEHQRRMHSKPDRMNRLHAGDR